MKILITGAAGQDAWYLSKLLLAKGFQVFGAVRPAGRLGEVYPGVERIACDVTDSAAVARVVETIRPAEIYHLAAQTHVGQSFANPASAFEVNALGTLHVLEAVRRYGGKVYQASTSELFGQGEPPFDEQSAMKPCSPYGIAKLAAHEMVRHYREAHGVFACAGILFNHESPKRGMEFVTQKIAHGVARMHLGLQDELRLGNLDAARDWGHAEDYVRGMWLMMQRAEPEDFVLATGKTHTVREFLERAFWAVGEKPHDITIDAALLRPTDVKTLCGDASQARKILGWQPRIGFIGTVNEMVMAALATHGEQIKSGAAA